MADIKTAIQEMQDRAKLATQEAASNLVADLARRVSNLELVAVELVKKIDPAIEPSPPVP